MPNADYYNFQYIRGQLRPTHQALLADFDSRGEKLLGGSNASVDISYGAAPRQSMDIFRTDGDSRGAILYFHAGYWQARDKSDFRFLAGPLMAQGFDVALANYPLCPNVSLDDLVASAAEAVPFLVDHLRERYSGTRKLIVAGHSAGGHIAVELALRTWPSSLCDGKPIEKIVAISGVYDLTPLVVTPLNDKLQLTEADAHRNSPIHRACSVAVPGFFVVGGDETDEFRRQSHEMANVWAEAGNAAEYIEIDSQDHFSVLDSFGSAQHPALMNAFGR